LNVGRLHHKKGLDLLPQALAPLRHLNWRMVFVGGDDDGTKAKLQQKFESVNLSDKVIFLERCEPKDLPAIYSAANLFLLPSRHENFGNVVIESLACGCPVLISDKVGMHHEVAQSGMGGVCPRITDDWTRTIREFLENSSDLFKVNTRKWIQAKFSMDETSREMLSYYISEIS